MCRMRCVRASSYHLNIPETNLQCKLNSIEAMKSSTAIGSKLISLTLLIEGEFNVSRKQHSKSVLTQTQIRSNKQIK